MTKRITVMSNDTANPRITLTLKGEIEVDVRPMPPSIVFSNILKGEKATKPLKIFVTNPKEKPLESVTLEDERFVVTRKKESTDGEALYDITFTGTDELGLIATRIDIKLKGEEKPKIDIPVRVQVVGNLRFADRMFINKRQNGFKDKEFGIVARNGEALRIKKAVDVDKNLRLKISKNNVPNVKLVATVLNTERSYLEPVRGTIEMETDDKETPLVKISYTIQEFKRPGSHGTPPQPTVVPKAQPGGQKMNKKKTKQRLGKLER